MLSIIFAFYSFVAWGVGDIFGTISSRKIGAYSTAFWYLLSGLIASSIYGLFVLGQLHLTLPIFIFTLIVGILGTIGLIAFYEALNKGSAALTGTVASASAALAAVIAVVFLKEKLTPFQILALIIVFTGIIISSLDFNHLKNGKFFNKGILFALIAFLFFGFYYGLIKIPVRELGWFWSTYIATLPVLLLPVFMKINKIKMENPIKKKALLPLTLNTLLLGTGVYSLNFAIEKGMAAVTVPVANAYPALFATLAFIVFKDPLEKRQVFGIVITIIGLIFLSVISK